MDCVQLPVAERSASHNLSPPPTPPQCIREGASIHNVFSSPIAMGEVACAAGRRGTTLSKYAKIQRPIVTCFGSTHAAKRLEQPRSFQFSVFNLNVRFSALITQHSELIILRFCVTHVLHYARFERERLQVGRGLRLRKERAGHHAARRRDDCGNDEANHSLPPQFQGELLER